MAHWGLCCDESLADFDALSVVEPYIYEDNDTGEPAFPVERNWQLSRLSDKQEGEARYAYRASMWVNKRHAAQQVVVLSSDVVVVTTPTKHSSTLIVSAYDVKSTDGQAASEEQLRSKLQTIMDAYDGVKGEIKSTCCCVLTSIATTYFGEVLRLWGRPVALTRPSPSSISCRKMLSPHCLRRKR
jgi:hypothetical protein